MPWLTVYHPSLIEKAVIRFIKEVWHFRNKPILVVLDPQGKVVCTNALHMMCIWRSNAFPFTRSREESLWRKETWRLELLVDGNIDRNISNWVLPLSNQSKYTYIIRACNHVDICFNIFLIIRSRKESTFSCTEETTMNGWGGSQARRVMWRRKPAFPWRWFMWGRAAKGRKSGDSWTKSPRRTSVTSCKAIPWYRSFGPG